MPRAASSATPPDGRINPEPSAVQEPSQSLPFGGIDDVPGEGDRNEAPFSEAKTARAGSDGTAAPQPPVQENLAALYDGGIKPLRWRAT